MRKNLLVFFIMIFSFSVFSKNQSSGDSSKWNNYLGIALQFLRNPGIYYQKINANKGIGMEAQLSYRIPLNSLEPYSMFQTWNDINYFQGIDLKLLANIFGKKNATSIGGIFAFRFYNHQPIYIEDIAVWSSDASRIYRSATNGIVGVSFNRDYPKKANDKSWSSIFWGVDFGGQFVKIKFLEATSDCKFQWNPSEYGKIKDASRPFFNIHFGLKFGRALKK